MNYQYSHANNCVADLIVLRMNPESQSYLEQCYSNCGVVTPLPHSMQRSPLHAKGWEIGVAAMQSLGSCPFQHDHGLFPVFPEVLSGLGDLESTAYGWQSSRILGQVKVAASLNMEV